MKLTDHKIDKQKSTRIAFNWTFCHLVQNISRSAPRTSQLSSHHALLHHSFKMRSNVNFLYMLQSSERYLHVLELKASMYFSSNRQDIHRPYHFL